MSLVVRCCGLLMGQEEERGKKCPYVSAALLNIYEQDGTETSLQEAAQVRDGSLFLLLTTLVT